MLVTTATSQRSNAEPLAEDAAAGRLEHGGLDRGFSSTSRALLGPLQSPASIRRSSM